MKLIVDGQAIPVHTQVVVINENVTGPVDGQTTDELKTIYTPDNAINYEVWELNTATTTPGRASHKNATTAQAIATTVNSAG